MSRATGLFRLIRPVNCIMMGLAVIVGIWVGTSNLVYQDLPNVALGFITAFALTGASMAINDYFDRDIDAINEPSRPIPSDMVTPKESLVTASLLTATGFAAALLTNIWCLLVAVISWGVSLAYAAKGKKTGLPGNLLVSADVSIPFVYGSLVIAPYLRPNSLLYTSLAFLSNTGREVTKGIVDLEGDKSKKIRTIAVTHGEKTAAYAASAFFLSAVVLSFLPVLLSQVSMWFTLFVSVADIGFVASSLMLMRDHSRDNSRRIKNRIMIWMMLSLIAFMAGNTR